MCTCIAGIKASYSEVQRETARVARKSYRNPVELVNGENFDIDEFLDAINLITKDLNQVTSSTNDLIEVVRNNFCEITPSEAEELLQLSHPIYKKMQQLHKKLLASPFYRGMQTAVGLYTDAMSDFDELCHDLKQFRIDLEMNEEFKETERLLSEMLRGWDSTPQHLAKKDGFRLIYLVLEKSDKLVLLNIYPKRGPQGIVDLSDTEYNRLILEMIHESQAHTLHQVDISNSLVEISTTSGLLNND